MLSSRGISAAAPKGQQVYSNTPNTTSIFNFTVPAGVTKLSMVIVGQGQDGEMGNPDMAKGGNGGNLRWVNNVPVTPGENLYVHISSFGTRIHRGTSINDPLILACHGGIFNGGPQSTIGYNINGQATGDLVGGGNGGFGAYQGAGGGAGGYSGNGGNGGTSSPGNPGAGGGGGGGSSASGSGGGGGVGLFGQGASGAGATTLGWGGFAGSGGGHGYNSAGLGFGGDGGAYGGGGGAGMVDPYYTLAGGTGGPGAARFIWGPNRAFPSTNTGDM